MGSVRATFNGGCSSSVFEVLSLATMDESFDRAQGLHSLPARYGKGAALRISAVLHLSAFLSLVVLYARYLQTTPALVTLAAIGCLLYLDRFRRGGGHHWAWLTLWECLV